MIIIVVRQVKWSSLMFYGFNHSIYRKVEYSDLCNKVLCPEVVKELRKPNVLFSDLHSMQNTKSYILMMKKDLDL